MITPSKMISCRKCSDEGGGIIAEKFCFVAASLVVVPLSLLVFVNVEFDVVVRWSLQLSPSPVSAPSPPQAVPYSWGTTFVGIVPLTVTSDNGSIFVLSAIVSTALGPDVTGQSFGSRFALLASLITQTTIDNTQTMPRVSCGKVLPRCGCVWSSKWAKLPFVDSFNTGAARTASMTVYKVNCYTEPFTAAVRGF